MYGFKKHIAFCVCCLLLWFSPKLQAQIAGAEYSVDSGPSVSMSAIDGGFDSIWEEIQASLGTLPQGVHHVEIRVQDLSGNWSPYFGTTISVEALLSARTSSVTMAEFQLDSNTPVSMLVLDGNWDEAYEQVLLDSQSISSGLHTLSIRIIGEDGVWSNSFSSVISAESPISARQSHITEAQYSIDAGSFQSMLVIDGNWDEAFEHIEQSNIALSSGIHTIAVRVRGLDGNWSNEIRSVISVEAPITSRSSSITQAEFWIDSDPAQAMLVIDGNWDEAFENVELNAVNAGAEALHTLNIRVMGEDGIWSNTVTSIISVESPITARNIKLTQAEYWIDSDPHQALLVSDGNWEEAFESVYASGIPSPGAGLHKLNIRVRGLDGNWSNTVSSIFSSEEPIASRLSQLQLAEVYFDENPGVSYTLASFDGNFDEAFEAMSGAVNSAVLTPGLHTVHMRTMDIDGSWSNAFKSVLFLDACTTSPTVEVTPSGTLDLCPNDSLLLTATAGMVSYAWYKGATEISEQSSIWVSEPGYYYVVGYDIEGCPGASEGVWVNETATPALTLTASGPLDFCASSGLTLTASGSFSSFVWSDASTGNNLSVSASGDYFVTGITAEGCEVYSDTLTVNVYDNPPAPIITASDDLILCQGDSVLLSSNYVSGNLWSTGTTDQSIWATAGGDYSVTYTDGGGCTSDAAMVSITQSQVVAQITPVGSQDICDGQSFNIIAQNGPGFNFQWLDNEIDIAGETAQSYLVEAAGIYSVVVSDALGCVDTSEVVVTNVLPSPDATITADGPATFCDGGEVDLSVSDGVSWLWNTGATTSSITATVAGDYQVAVTGANGCISVSEFFSIEVGTPLLGFTADPPIVWLPDADVQFSASTQGTIVSYDWDFGDGQTSPNNNPINSYTASGFYDVSLTVTDDAGCMGTLTGTDLVEVWEIFDTDSLGIGSNTEITGISFNGSHNGCITLSDGTVLATTDGGVTWIDVTGTIGADNLNDIYLGGDAIDNIAIVVGDDGVAAISENGGSWTTPATGTNENLNGVVPGDGGIYYAFGDNGTVICYQNGTWTNISYPGGTGINFGTGYYWGGVLYVVGSNGIIYSWNGTIWGAGASFGGGGSGIGGGALGFGGGGSGIGIFAGGAGSGGGIWTSSDGGGSWTQTFPGNGYGFNSVYVSDDFIICVGDHGMVVISTDGGNTWTVLSVGNTEDLTDIEAENCIAYITGADGSVYSFEVPNYQAAPPTVFVEPFLVNCGTDDVTMSVLSPRPGNTYIWSTGVEAFEIPITETGTYFVTMYDFCDTISTTPILVTVNEPASWHPDLDGDGFGDKFTEVLACEQPGPEYVLDDRDCFDDDPNLVLCCPGDINDDGVINTADLTLLLGNFGSNCGSAFCGGDINGDGLTNTADLTVLLSFFGGNCDDF